MRRPRRMSDVPPTIQCALCGKETRTCASRMSRRFCSVECRKGYFRLHTKDETLCVSALQQPGTTERFWKFVDKTDTCWLWTGTTTGGYGRFNIGSYRTHKAHRVSYVLAYGEFDQSLLVCHKCDNPQCVRPDHLFLGTHADNMSDMAVKGRHVSYNRGRPELIWSRKLSREKAAEIRARFSAGVSARELAKVYGVLPGQIRKVAKGDAWAERQDV